MLGNQQFSKEFACSKEILLVFAVAVAVAVKVKVMAKKL
jgi:hypothetical protein